MTRGMEHRRAKKAASYVGVAFGAAALGALPGLLSQGSKIAETPPAADTSQFIPPDCETMPKTNGWEQPLCEKMAQVGRTILSAYNDGDIRNNGAYQWKFTPQPDGFSIGTSGELPGTYSARFHRTDIGVRLMEIEETIGVTDGSMQKYDVETEPDPLSPANSQLHLTVTRLDQPKLPQFLYDSHTQATDTAMASAMGEKITVPEFH